MATALKIELTYLQAQKSDHQGGCEDSVYGTKTSARADHLNKASACSVQRIRQKIGQQSEKSSGWRVRLLQGGRHGRAGQPHPAVRKQLL